MIHAYSESYLNNAKDRLSQFLDYMINDCALEPDWVTKLFVTSGYAELFEKGNPSILAGKSGVELGRAVLKKTYQKQEFPEASFSESRSQEYWAGWVLAEYQWETARRYRDIFSAVPLSEILTMYPVYHEMDISHFIGDLEERVKARLDEKPTRLRQIRENSGLSQNELAATSGVNVRSIRAYEQRKLDIDSAQVQTLYKLSLALGCRMEDLLENPLSK